MREDFASYWDSLVKDIPSYAYWSLLIVFFIGVSLVFFKKGIQDGWRYVIGLLLIEYIALLLFSTVVFRSVMSERKYDFMPFWSYRAYISGVDPRLLAENIMNVVVFVPIGLLLGAEISQKKQKGWLIAFIVGAGISVTIETLQFVLKRGFSELDDVMHNALGCMIGYGVFMLIKRLLRYE